MKAVKVILGILVAAVVVVAIVIVIALQNINGIVKTAVETVGPEVTKTEVRLSEVDIVLTEGKGALRGLTIANPSGFSNANAFSLGEVSLQIDPASLTGDVIVINEILITGAQLLAEQKNIKDTNLQALLNNVTAGSSNASSASSTAESGATDSGDSVRLAVEKFTFSASEVRLVTEQWGERTLKLPAIKLKNLGSKDKGLTPAELTQAVLKPILAQAKAAVSKQLEEIAKDKAEAKMKEKLDDELDDEQKGQLNKLKSLFGK